MRKPISKQQSPWVEMDAEAFPEGYRSLHRSVGDGHLFALVAQEPEVGWHLSVSFRNHKGEHSRYPTWDELAHAREQLLPSNLAFAMHFPVEDEYVAVHPTTFHLYQTQ